MSNDRCSPSAFSTLPVTTILFLKHLERVEVTVETEARSEGFSWTVRRERRAGDEWEPCTGLLESGIYRIRVASASGETHDFLFAHDAEVEIGGHRGGLDAYAWEGIEISEVSVAALSRTARPLNFLRPGAASMFSCRRRSPARIRCSSTVPSSPTCHARRYGSVTSATTTTGS